jgi:hypothetical protein
LHDQAWAVFPNTAHCSPVSAEDGSIRADEQINRPSRSNDKEMLANSAPVIEKRTAWVKIVQYTESPLVKRVSIHAKREIAKARRAAVKAGQTINPANFKARTIPDIRKIARNHAVDDELEKWAGPAIPEARFFDLD